MKKLRYIFLAVTTPILLLSAVVSFYAFNESWYASMARGFPEPERASLQEAQAVFTYIKSGDIDERASYTDRERAHLLDIRNLFTSVRLGLIALAVLWGVAAVLLQKKEDMVTAASYISAGLKWFVIILVTAAGCVGLFFDQIFLQFHYVAFRNTFWQLNPETENLIWTFPPEYFYVTALRISIVTFIICLMLIHAFTISQLLLKKRKQNEKN